MLDIILREKNLEDVSIRGQIIDWKMIYKKRSWFFWMVQGEIENIRRNWVHLFLK